MVWPWVCSLTLAQSDPGMIKQIMEAVSIPVMAKVRIGHTVEAQILQSVGVDYIDVSRSLYLPPPSTIMIACSVVLDAEFDAGIRSPHHGRRPTPHWQARIQGAFCVWMQEPRRGAEEDFRGCSVSVTELEEMKLICDSSLLCLFVSITQICPHSHSLAHSPRSFARSLAQYDPDQRRSRDR